MRWTFVLLWTALLGACTPDKPAEPTPDAPAAPALLSVSATSEGLLYRYRTEDGFANATTLDEIPADARAAVQVIDLTRSPEDRHAGAFVQVFDLRVPGPEGRFPGRVVPRAGLEQALAEAAKTPAQAPVTMYSASWCGVCKKARAFLHENGVAFVEKDIEKDQGAARELAEKAQKAGVSTNGVPIFDVGGHILSGFDGPTLLRAARGG
ncbi:MAG: glutaredoxin family protein [Myxococcales bacterium]|nr:glutaredoxin family protein [Myxococcales bacterium]